MMIDVWHTIGGYFYDVFIVRLDWWAWVGILAQLLFTARFIVQWIASERAGRSVMPVAFWWFSIGGGIMLLIYALFRRDPVFILGQGLGLGIYARNLWFVLRERASLARRIDSAASSPEETRAPRTGREREIASERR
jgi:lipid-A-disaccharide synthase-like uncharacterized protein